MYKQMDVSNIFDKINILQYSIYVATVYLVKHLLLCHYYLTGIDTYIMDSSIIPVNSGIFTFPTRFYESLNEQNQICELCTFVCTYVHQQLRIHNISSLLYIKQVIIS